ncbi:ribonuclease-like [Carettochelys insculpta]|uniref:ribonuclease-like n=1 Tax=Carettochelys insculpta TaxID=44489 RepID=UPI003EBA2E2C
MKLNIRPSYCAKINEVTDLAMALRGLSLTLLLLLALPLSCLALASTQSCLQRHREFVWRHVDYPQTQVSSPSAYCKTMISKRGLYGMDVNTFIHVRKPLINIICSVNGTPLPNGTRRSNAYFTITTCRYNPETGSYISQNRTQKIVLRCCKELPESYEEEK